MKHSSSYRYPNNTPSDNGYSKAAPLLLAFFFLLFSGCAPSNGPFTPTVSQQRVAGGQLSLFLNLIGQQGQHLQIRIQSIEVLTDNNQWYPMIDRPIDADSRLITNGQIFLARSVLPPGYYTRLRFKTTLKNQPTQAGPEAESTVTELEIRNPLYLTAEDSHSLFLTWDVSRSFSPNNDFSPKITLAPRLKNLLVDVAYIACPEINTIYMIRTDKNWVCNSLGVSGSPSYLVSDRNAPTENLYALTDNEKKITQIGPASNRIEGIYNLSSVGKPLHMTISPNSQWGYVVDRKRGNILRINLRSGSIEARNRLGYEPSYILYLEKQKLLAVSLSQSQSVVLLDPMTLTQVQTISTRNKPEGLMLYNDTYLYIAESGGNSVMAYNLTRNILHKRISVGLSPMRLLQAGGQIYVTNHNSQTLSILKHGQLAPSKTIKLGGSPLELAYSSTNKWLYVGNESTKSLDVIDPINNRVVGHIPLNALPQGIAVLQ